MRAPTGILCQGRGSAANSAVCYCLGITEVDPARIELLFERFISDERDEPPDIDVDFEHERREEVMQYIYKRYGRAPRRAHRHRHQLPQPLRPARCRQGAGPLGRSDRCARSNSLWGGASRGPQDEHIRRARPRSARPTGWRRHRALAQELVGFPRHLSQHTGGFVITRGRLDETRAHRPMPRWRTAPQSNGTRTISMRSAFSRSMCWRSACSPASPRVRAFAPALRDRSLARRAYRRRNARSMT